MFEDDVDLPSGRSIDGFLRIEGREVAVVFAVTHDQQALLVEQYKYGADSIVMQLPAGYLEADEEPEIGARRELLEETGYAASSWEHLGSFWMDGSRGFGRTHLFLARDAESVQGPADDEYEQLVLHHVPLQRVAQMLRDGSFAELSIVAGISLALLRLAPESSGGAPPARYTARP